MFKAMKGLLKQPEKGIWKRKKKTQEIIAKTFQLIFKNQLLRKKKVYLLSLKK